MEHQQQDRVRKNTSLSKNQKIDQLIEKSFNQAIKNHETINSKIKKLEKEWDIERWLETNASIIAFIGVVLAFFVNIYWLILSALVLLFLFQHALQGWCPPVPLFRRLGVRTQKEIDSEIYGLKLIRGDFENVNKKSVSEIINSVKLV